MFCVYLRRMCILLLLDGMSDRFICSLVLFKFAVCLLILCLDDLLIVERGILKLPTIIVFPFTSPLGSVRICFMYLGALVLGTQKFTIVISS